MNIKTDSRNYRIHGDKNKALINKSLTECGAGRSILIDKDDVIIAGNGVYEQAQALGLKVRVVESDGSELIAVKRTDLTTEDERRKLLAFADNQTSDTSFFDVNLLLDDFNTDDLAVWELDTGLFSDNTIDDLETNAFAGTIKENSDVFTVSFSFPKEKQEQVEGYIKTNGKTGIVDLILNLVCQSVEAK